MDTFVALLKEIFLSLAKRAFIFRAETSLEDWPNNSKHTNVFCRKFQSPSVL